MLLRGLGGRGKKYNLNRGGFRDFVVLLIVHEEMITNGKKLQSLQLFLHAVMSKEDGWKGRNQDLKEIRGQRTHRVPSHPNQTAAPGSADPSTRCPLASPAWRLIILKTKQKKNKTPTQRRKVFLFAQVLSLPLCSVPQTLKRTDGEHYDASTGSCNLHICSAGHAFLLFRLGACGGRRIRRLAAVVMVRVGGFVHGCG